MLALSGEKNPAKATMHTIPRFVGVLNTVYGVSWCSPYFSGEVSTGGFGASILLI